MDRVCKGCGKEFSTAFQLKLYCSEECRRRAIWARKKINNKYAKICAECGKEFNSGRDNAKYCSMSCAGYHANRARREAKALEPPKVITYSKVCQWCGKGFEAKRADTRFCSPSCGMSWVRAEQAKNKPPKAEAKHKRKEKEKEWKLIKLPPVEKKVIKYGTPKSDIAKVEAASRAAGLSYGQFVAGYLAPQERSRRALIEARRTELERLERARQQRIDELLEDIGNLR